MAFDLGMNLPLINICLQNLRNCCSVSAAWNTLPSIFDELQVVPIASLPNGRPFCPLFDFKQEVCFLTIFIAFYNNNITISWLFPILRRFSVFMHFTAYLPEVILLAIILQNGVWPVHGTFGIDDMLQQVWHVQQVWLDL